MAASSSTAPTMNPNTEIVIKIHAQGVTRKLKLPLKDLVPSVLPQKLRTFLGVREEQVVVFERFSDSSANYVNLDGNNVQAYKTLYRAAKAKLKLRLRAHIGPLPNSLTGMNTLALDGAGSSSAAAEYAKTIQGLADLNFGPKLELGNFAAPAPASTGSVAAASAKSASELAADVSAHDTVAAAVADFCCNRQAEAQAPIAPASIEAKNDAFARTIREMDEQLKLKIGAFKAHQASLAKLTKQTAHELNAGVAINAEPRQSKCPAMRMSGTPKLPEGATCSWFVYCNRCNKNMLEEHFHCNTCQNGDYDLCTECMAEGKHCLDEGHWLIKRFLRDGKVVNGETQTFSPSLRAKAGALVDMPGAFAEEKKSEELKKPTRTCNCCVRVLCEDDFVNCSDCNDYDLCLKCLQSGEHGHHPAHTFVPATDATSLSTHAIALCKPGRNVTHTALCDECDSRIVGIRYKCLVCPDWDYCSGCMQSSATTHKGHRFTPIYDCISPQAYQWAPTHVGVYCDGPLCKDKNAYITGVRYKCAVCGDLDFCAGCEALPHLEHNKTHPLLKFRTPVRGCSVTTMVGTDNTPSMAQEHVSKTQVCTVAEVEPVECPPAYNQAISEDHSKTFAFKPSSAKAEQSAAASELQAHFTRDTVSDETVFEPKKQFTQVWTLRNPGPEVWPAGCSVRFVGGDNMLNIVEDVPSSDSDFCRATESNVTRREIGVGEECSFRVLMQAPKREGVAISYWRLKTADGTPFGHRLWCHIVVRGKAESVRASPEVGRLGSHDAFLRYSLNQQIKKEVQKADAEATMREIAAEMRSLRPRRSASRLPEGAAPKSEKVKIEVVESTEAAAYKPRLAFPVLDVESSASSAGSEHVVTNAATVENVAAVAAAPIQPEAIMLDDAESITLAESIDLSDDDSDDGFMTEDEYDILDASDHELA